MNKLAIIGAGGHGKVAADIAKDLNWKIHFFDATFPKNKFCGDWEILGSDEGLATLKIEYDAVFIAIGNNKVRKEKQAYFKSLGFPIATLISKNANLGSNVQIGEGSLVVSGATINIDTTLKEGVIVNTGATIDHDCNVGAFSHISPGVNLAGNVSVGKESWLGIGSTVIQSINIADNVVLGAGSVVISDLESNIVAVGCPAKKL